MTDVGPSMPAGEVLVPLGDARQRARLAETAERLDALTDRMPADHPMYARTRALARRWASGYRPMDESDDE